MGSDPRNFPSLDILIGAGIFNFHYTLEYSFFALLLAMDYILVTRYNLLFLELQVANRTEKIQRMIDSIYDLNRELES
jgi:hypothetical protein